jgi:flagellar biosynthetic protein FliP
MALAMVIGMIASAAIFVTAVGTTVDEALRQHAVLFVVVQALGMSVAMVAWMRHRGHGWRSCAEMAGAMVVPAIPLIALRLAGTISGPICGAYCALSIAAMVLVMFYRRSDYTGTAALHAG